MSDGCAGDGAETAKGALVVQQNRSRVVERRRRHVRVVVVRAVRMQPGHARPGQCHALKDLVAGDVDALPARAYGPDDACARRLPDLHA